MMILVMAAALVSAAAQNATINSARDGLRNCFKEAATKAKADKMAKEAFEPFARSQCAAQATKFTDAVRAFDSKNKLSKKQSNADAELQIEDFLFVATEKFEAEGNP